jgi:endonuclease I
VLKKKPTGYISEIHNLVPACGKCNQSKGNKEWRQWMLSDATLSPKTKGFQTFKSGLKGLKHMKVGEPQQEWILNQS